MLEEGNGLFQFGKLDEWTFSQLVKLLIVPKDKTFDLVLLELPPRLYGELIELHQRPRLHKARAIDFVDFLQTL